MREEKTEKRTIELISALRPGYNQTHTHTYTHRDSHTNEHMYLYNAYKPVHLPACLHMYTNFDIVTDSSSCTCTHKYIQGCPCKFLRDMRYD